MKVEIAFQGSGLYWGSADINAEQYLSLKALLFGRNYTEAMRAADAANVESFEKDTNEE